MAKPQLDPRVDAFIEQAPEFAQPLLRNIRAAFHAGCPDLVENIKWGVPSFERNGLLGGMASFKKHVSYGFWRAAEMEDPHELLGDTRKASPMRIKASVPADLPKKAVLVSYVKQARKLDEEVSKPARKPIPKKSKTAPKFMLNAIDKNAKAKAFWGGLTPGYKRDYIEWVTEAKREATKEKRLAQTVLWLSESKTKNWKYMDC